MMAFRSAARQIGIVLRLDLRLARIEDMVELLHLDFERDFAEHLNEAAVAVVSKTLVAALCGQTGGGLVVQAQVQNGVHHARHGELRAGAHAQQQRIRRVAQLLPHLLFQLHQSFVDFCFDFRRESVSVVEVGVTDMGRDGEARGHRQTGARHLGEACAFAAEDIFHLAVAVGCAAAEGIYVLAHLLS